MTSVLLLIALGVMMHAAGSFVPTDPTRAMAAGTGLAFGFLLLSAFFGGKVFARLRSPQLTGYIAVGVAAGPHALGLVTGEMIDGLKIVNGAAVCLIALTAGGELSIARMRPLLRTIRSMTMWAVLGTTVAIAVTVMAIRPLLPFLAQMGLREAAAVSLMLAVTLASQSPAVVMALINETRSDGPVSQTTLALVVIADLVVIVLYALASSATTALVGDGVNVLVTVKKVAWELFGSAGVGVVIGVMLGLFLRLVERGAAMFVVLVCVVVAEVGARIHLDPLIVTLTAGVYLENVSKADAHKLISDLEAASLPVYLVFFALAGAGLKLDLLAAVVVPAAIVAVVRGIGFWLGCGVAARRTAADAQVAKWTWVGLLPQAGLALALALLMQRAFPAFGEHAAALVLGVVGLNQVITPVLLRLALIWSGEAGKRGASGTLDRPHGPPSEAEHAAPS